jgi:hypothetical protein
MNRLAMTITCILGLVAFIHAQQLANGGFESWTNQTLFENPVDWESANGQAPGLVNVTKVSGPSGTYAVRLETTTFSMDTLFGFVLLGDFDNNGDPVAGVPFSTGISNITGMVRHDLMMNDSAYVVFVAYAGGSMIAQETIRFSGSQNTWMPFSHPVTSGPITPDSVLLGMASSNPFDNSLNSPGSWIEFDDIQLTSPNVPTPDLLPNQDFESWFNVVAEVPDNWGTLNELTAASLGPLATKSTDAAVGTYSIRLANTTTDDGDTISSILTNGDIESFGATGGVPYVAVPQLMTGQYKWLPDGTDTAYISISLLDNGILIGTGLFGLTQAVPNWTSFSQMITTIGTPDTMRITVVSGFNPGSVLFLDDLDLSGGTVGLNDQKKESSVVYPIPADDILYLRLSDYSEVRALEILDITGKHVRSLPLSALKNPIPINELKSGVYLLRVQQQSGVQAFRFVKS